MASMSTSYSLKTQRQCFFLILFSIAIWFMFSMFLRYTIFGIALIDSVNDLLINQRIVSLNSYKSIHLQENLLNQEGLLEMMASDVTILGVGRNVADHLTSVLTQVELLCRFFNRSSAVFVEGDSTDSSRSILESWISKSKENRTLLFLDNQIDLLEKEGAFQGLPVPREGRISNARNYGLEFIRKHNITKYIIIIDLDQIGWEITGIVDSFSYSNWDVMCAYGTFFNGIYRDSYAVRFNDINTNHHRYGDDYEKYNFTLNDRHKNYRHVKASKKMVHKTMKNSLSSAHTQLAHSRIIYGYDNPYNGAKVSLRSKSLKLEGVQTESFGNHTQLVRLDSCFGGLSIYRSKILEGCEYSYRHKEYPNLLDCEHVLFNKCLRNRNNARIYSNPNMKLWFGHNPITMDNINKLIRDITKIPP